MVRAMPSPPRRILVPLIVACGLMMENLDSAVLATSLPAIAESLGENPLHLSLAITSYLFSLAVFIPISGWFADRFGARNVFRTAIIIFILGSIASGMSQNLTELVLARLLQGLGGSMMVPVGRLVVLRTVSKAEMVNAMAWLTTPALIGPVLGPPVGGFITTYLSWRCIFWLNVPIALIGIVLVSLFIENTRESNVPPLDWRGFALTSVGLAAAMFGFETLGRGIVPLALSISLLAAGAAILTVYVLHTRRAQHPILALSLLAIPTFRASVIGGFVFRMGIGAIPFLLPLMLQIGFGLSPFESGMLTFAGAAGALTMKMTAAPILRTFGFKRVLLVNGVVVGLSLAAIGLFQQTTPAWVILAVLLTGGFFRSLQFTSVNTLGYADIPTARMSQATSFASMAQQLSLTVGVAAGALLLHFTQVLRGGSELGAGDFVVPFFAVGLMATIAGLTFAWLPADAAVEVSGKRLGRRPEPQAAPAEAKLSPAPGE
jgi:EmrB/QacA subfamily drug resistance transporter